MAEPGPQAGLSHDVGDLAAEGSRPVLAVVRAFPAQAGHVDLDVHVGDVVHLRGGNGSGKTSMLRNLAGLDAPLRATHVSVGAEDPRTTPATRLTSLVRVAWSSSRANLVGLTVSGEFRLRGLPLPAELATFADRDVATLSSGEAARVSLAAVAASPAALLLLDEPCSSLDAEGLDRLADIVREAAGKGAVVVADHTGWAQQVATRTVELGRTEATPSPAVPRPNAAGKPKLTASAISLMRGRTQVELPDIRFGAGFHAVTGRNGAGKSTLLQHLAGLRDATDVSVDGAKPTPGANVRLLQAGAGDLLMEGTVADEISGTADPEGLVPAALLGRHPLSLSAGEAQRVALVKAIGRAAPVHLLDEPDAHLDADARGRLLAAIARRVEGGACVVAATHDAALLAAAHSQVEVGA